MSRRALVALGVGQCLNWGVLYYAFAALVVPLQRELGAETWLVTGAFSGALLMSAALAPAVGRLADRGLGPRVMQAGGVVAAALLFAWTGLPGLMGLYVVWAGLGCCMAATLYEPAFVIVGRAHPDPAARLRALAGLTLLGGLASTVVLPPTVLSIAAFGWRGAVMGLAVVLGVATWLTRRLAFDGLSTPPAPGPSRLSASPLASRARSIRFAISAGMFTLMNLGSSGLVTNLVPALGERGVTPTTAALLGSLWGVMQLPGRAVLWSGMRADAPALQLAVSLALHAAGLGIVAVGDSLASVATGLAAFAAGAGFATLVRPHLVFSMLDVERGGFLSGRIARQQQFARALGPFLVAWLASRVGYTAVLAALAVTCGLAAAPAALRIRPPIIVEDHVPQ